MDREELEELGLATFVISLSFTIAMFGFENFLENFAKVLIFVSPSFFLHELAHKYFAIGFRSYARFFSYKLGLLISLISSFFGFIVALPGAVYIFGNLSREENGIVSLAGPMVNIFLSILFYLLAGFVFVELGGYNAMIIGAKINAFLAFFNLLPIPPLDGKKVFDWNKKAWLFSILTSFVLFSI